MSIFITNCRIISPDKEQEDSNIEIDSGIIKNIGYRNNIIPSKDDYVIDAKGKIAIPGLVDIHCHGANGYDSTDGSLNSIKNIAKTKMKEGVTSFCPTTLTLPEETLTKTFESVAKYKEDEKYSKVLGIHLEGPYINPERLGAQNPEYVRNPDIKEIKRLKQITNISKVTYAPEVESALEFTKELKKLNIVPSCGHSDCTYHQFLQAKANGASQLTHLCNQMRGLHHREIGLVGAGLLDNEILTEIIPDKIHLSPDMLKLIFKSKHINDIALITDSISASGLKDGDYILGGLEVKVKDSVARLVKNGNIAGSTLKFYEGLKNIIDTINLPINQLIKTAAYNQATSLGLNNLGKIEEGYKADLVLLRENDFKPEYVFINGELKHKES